MAFLQDTDLMLVSRGGTAYQATGREVIDGILPTTEQVNTPTLFTPPSGAGMAPGTGI